LAEAMSRQDVSRVYAHALLSNRGSIRVMEKAGRRLRARGPTGGLPGAEYEARAPFVGATPGPLSAPAKRP
jgi:RimJ/RimL family protein N-acetyltransferase